MDFNTLRYLQRANVAAYIREESEEQKAYSDLFDSILKKHGADSPNDLPDEKKDDFFNEVEREWAKHPKNKKDDGESTNEELDKEKEDDEEEDKKVSFGEGWAANLAKTRKQMLERKNMYTAKQLREAYRAGLARGLSEGSMMGPPGGLGIGGAPTITPGGAGDGIDRFIDDSLQTPNLSPKPRATRPGLTFDLPLPPGIPVHPPGTVGGQGGEYYQGSDGTWYWFPHGLGTPYGWNGQTWIPYYSPEQDPDPSDWIG